MNKKMAIGIIIIGALILIVGLILSLKTLKPMYVNLIAAVVILVPTVFAAIGKQLQDESSSKKSDKIIATGESTEQKVIRLQTTIDEQATTIDSLRRENTDLHAKLAAKSIEIFDVAKKGLDVSVAGFNEQRQNFVAQNRPVLQVENFQIGERMDEFFNYEIRNVNINPAQIIWIVHGVARNKPDLKASPSNIKIFEGRKLFRPPHGSRYYPEYLRSVYAVSNLPLPTGLHSPFMRMSSFRSGEIPLYFVGQVYYTDQVTDKVFDYMFCVELRVTNGKLQALYLRNEPPIEIPPRPIKPGVDEPNASFDYYLDLAK